MRESTVPSKYSQLASQELVKRIRQIQKVIYGEDRREEVESVVDSEARARGDAVAAMFMATSLRDVGDGTARLELKSFKDAYNLCNSEPYGDQPVGAFGTCFLVSSTVVATAGHCADGSRFPLEDTRVVFGFRTSNGVIAPIIEDSDVYRCRSVVMREYDRQGVDYALIELDRPVSGRNPLAVRREGIVPDGESLYVIGHPCGLPSKYADGAGIRVNSSPLWFLANLDTYGGNSGSPVFSSKTHLVEGMLVRGERDFRMVGGCRVSLVCPDGGCRGETCLRTTVFSEYIPVE